MAEDTPPVNPISKEVTDEICPPDELESPRRQLVDAAGAEKRKLSGDQALDGSGEDIGGRRLKRVKSDGGESSELGPLTATALLAPLQDAIETEETTPAVVTTAPVAAAVDRTEDRHQEGVTVQSSRTSGAGADDQEVASGEAPLVVREEEEAAGAISPQDHAGSGLSWGLTTGEAYLVTVHSAQEQTLSSQAAPSETTVQGFTSEDQHDGAAESAMVCEEPSALVEEDIEPVLSEGVNATAAVETAVPGPAEDIAAKNDEAKSDTVAPHTEAVEAAVVEVLAPVKPAATNEVTAPAAAATTPATTIVQSAVNSCDDLAGQEAEAAAATATATEDTAEAPSNTSCGSAHDQLDETASKLLASGISISLIKKKKDNSAVASNAAAGGGSEEEEAVATGSADNPPKNALEVGPNISVTMINRSASTAATASEAGNAGPAAGRFTLSLKSQSELMDPRRSSSETASVAAAGRRSSSSSGGGGLADTLTVSRVVSRSPSLQQQQQQQAAKAAAVSSKSPMLGSHSLMSPPLSRPGTAGGTVGSSPPVAGGTGLQHHARQNGGLVSRGAGGGGGGGSVSDQLNAVAAGIADYMRHGIEEILRDLAQQGSPEATIKGLQLELERMQWRHQQELAEVKQNIEVMMKEMKTNLTKESQRTIEEFKKQAELEKAKAVAEAKKKQWCANCGKEAIFYCCWNTSYCDYPCQQAHWPAHMATCSQTNQDEDSNAAGGGGINDQLGGDHKMLMNHHPHVGHHQQQQQQQHHHHQANSATSLLNSFSRQSHHQQQQQHHAAAAAAAMGLGALGLVNGMVGGPPGGGGFVMPPGMGGGGMGLRPGGGMAASMRSNHPMGVSIRPGMPGQLTISRPYFM